MAGPRRLPFLMTCLLVMGCSDPPNEELPNPASTYCTQHGGELTIVKEPSGEWGKCVFDDGSWCEEWAFYRGECRKGQNAAQITPAPGT